MNGIMLDTVLFNRDIRYPGGRADSIRPYGWRLRLFQEICNIVSIQIEGYFGILMGQVVVYAG